MNNELVLFDNSQILVKQGMIEFNNFEKLKREALLLSEQIMGVEVTEDNVKTSKKMLAVVNNRIKEMEDRRISIKKEMLEPYTSFEKQVKEIVSIVKEADSVVRDQVKSLEEREREQKMEQIRDIFEKRIKHYDFTNLFRFDSFLTSKHLNKSTSMKTIETEMVQWLEKIDSDIQVIHTLPNSERVLTEYLDTKDVAVAIRIVNEYEERMNRVIQDKPVSQTNKLSFVITLEDEKDMKLVEMFMQQNKINYKSEKVAK